MRPLTCLCHHTSNPSTSDLTTRSDSPKTITKSSRHLQVQSHHKHPLSKMLEPSIEAKRYFLQSRKRELNRALVDSLPDTSTLSQYCSYHQMSQKRRLSQVAKRSPTGPSPNSLSREDPKATYTYLLANDNYYEEIKSLRQHSRCHQDGGLLDYPTGPYEEIPRT